MELAMNRGMTQKERHWRSHLERASKQGKALSDYARANDLDVRTLYRWGSDLRKRGWLEDAKEKAPAFVPARIETSTQQTPWRIVFPNGVSVELLPPAAVEQCAGLLKALRSLP